MALVYKGKKIRTVDFMEKIPDQDLFAIRIGYEKLKDENEKFLILNTIMNKNDQYKIYDKVKVGSVNGSIAEYLVGGSISSTSEMSMLFEGDYEDLETLEWPTSHEIWERNFGDRPFPFNDDWTLNEEFIKDSTNRKSKREDNYTEDEYNDEEDYGGGY